MEYTSQVWKASALYPGVEYCVRRMSLAGRIELGERIRELGLKGEFLEAGGRIEEQVEAGLIRRRIEKNFLEWGLAGIRGLVIDGAEADAGILCQRGPEDLCHEIVSSIQAELQLTEEERKN